MFPANEHSTVLSCVEWVLYCLFSTLLGLTFCSFFCVCAKMTVRGVQVCAGLMAYIILDLQMQVLRQLEGTFKDMEETSGQLETGEIPWIL